jgi:ribulose 1,5-bisphosphate synthetase/thiazole synthase
MANASRRITRRTLVTEAAAFGIAASTAAGRSRRALTAPDKTRYDVVVVGAGAAGLAAALGARRADPSCTVAVLEAKPDPGGTSFRSGGRLWIPNNSDMRAAGFHDPKDMALRYMARLAYPRRYDPDHRTLGLEPRHLAQLAAYYDRGAEILDYYRVSGILKWEAERWRRFPWNADPLHLEGTFMPDYHPELAEDVPKRGRTVTTRLFDPTTASDHVTTPDPNYGASLAGVDLVQWLFAAALRAGVQFDFDTRVVDVIATRGRRGRSVTGVHAATSVADTTLPLERRYRATRGVVFASGGFSKSAAKLRQRFVGNRAFTGGGCAVTSAVGDLVDVAQRHGLMLENMDQAWLIENVYEQYKLDPDSRLTPNYLFFQAYWLNGDSMIVVNRRGVRVVDEKLNYNDRTRAHQHPDNRFLFCVFDEHCLQHYFIGLGGAITPFVQTMAGPARDAAQLRAQLLDRMHGDRELAAFGLAPEFARGFDATLARFNQFARDGVDRDFHRGDTSIEIWWHAFSLFFENVSTGIPGVGIQDPISANVDEQGRPYPNVTMRPLRAPFYAVILSSGLQDTKGGPAIDASGRMLDLAGRPVPGLYGAGNCIGSPAGAGYWGAGGTIGPAVVFGHIAGEHAARRRR